MQNKKISIFTDGSSKGNPGPGGYGIVMRCGSYEKEFSQGFLRTTNNRMELLAVIVALESINWSNSEAVVYSDSSYVVDAVKKGWVFGWEKMRFVKKKNPDLWIRFLKVYRKHRVDFIWIRGHSGHPENERCDKLAFNAASSQDLIVDIGFNTEEPAQSTILD